MNYKDFKKNLLKDPEFREEYFKIDLKLEIAKMMIKARIMKGITQKELAKLIETKQPSIARIERGDYLPSLRLLEKIAKAMNTYLIPPRFAFLEDKLNESPSIFINVTCLSNPAVLEAYNIINKNASHHKIISNLN